MIWFRTKDHFASAFSDGSDSRCWNIDIETDTGQTIRIHVGPESRLQILEMLQEGSALNAAQVDTDEKSNCN